MLELSTSAGTDCTAALQTIIEDEPHLFLDAFCGSKGRFWSSSPHHWMVLAVQIALSLQVAYVSAGQRDNEERLQHMAALEAWVVGHRQKYLYRLTQWSLCLSSNRQQ
jgi:hypothetical protein